MNYIEKIEICNLDQVRDTYLNKLPVVRNLIKKKELNLDKPVTFFTGDNGAGKSTLIEAIAIAFGFNPEGGSENFNFSTYNSHSILSKYITIKNGIVRPKDGFFLRAESFYNIASYIESLDQIKANEPLIKDFYGGKSLHDQSHGEGFLSIMLNRFIGNGIYILDEPEAALSINNQFTLISQIDNLVRNKSQFIISTHSPYLLAYPNATIYVIDDDQIKKIPYKETDNYILSKEFLNNPERYINYILGKQ